MLHERFSESLYHFGAFDLVNYGDVLYPLLLQKMLRRKTKIVGFQSSFSPLGNYYTTAIETIIKPIAFEGRIIGFQSIKPLVVGGGDLLRTDLEEVAKIYGLTRLPTTLKFAFAIDNAVYLSVGCPWPLQNPEYKFRSPLVWLRDYQAKENFSHAKHKVDKVIVAPDLVCVISDFYPQFKKEDYILIQAINLEANIEEIIRLSRKHRILLCPVNHYAGDIQHLAQIAEWTGFELVVPTSVENIVQLIASAKGVISSSMHVGITAFSYNVPFLFMPEEGLVKRKGFLEIVGLPLEVELQNGFTVDFDQCPVSESLIASAKEQVYGAFETVKSYL